MPRASSSSPRSTSRSSPDDEREHAALAPRLTPHGHLLLVPTDGAEPLVPEVAARLTAAFARGAGHGLLALGAAEVGTALPPSLRYWRELGAAYVTALCALPDIDGSPAPAVPTPSDDALAAMVAVAPPMTGAEYLAVDVLRALWEELDRAFADERAAEQVPVQEFLRRRHPAWNLVGRVCFNLAENRKDEAAPFAFMATYTSRLSASATARHLPLAQALREYAGAAHKDRLLSLLLPVQRAAEGCSWLREMIDAGDVFHPLRWSPAQALRLLADVPKIEAAGVVVRVPASWPAGRPPRPRVTATVGKKAPGGLGQDALLDFQSEVTLEGEPLSDAELAQLLAGTEGLAMLRGRWIEIDRDRLRAMLAQLAAAERAARDGGVTFAAAMRLLAGADLAVDGAAGGDRDWSQVTAGPWLAETLRALRSPEHAAAVEPGAELRATLRPYQAIGVRWLDALSRLGLGACLADDMGLGKTLQVLALLVAQRRQRPRPTAPCLLVAPASLLANWSTELARFAPALDALVAHPSVVPAAELKAMPADRVAGVNLVITSYGSVPRLPWLTATAWDLVILDEAQAIKNPGAKQTRAVKQLEARARIALTGTPVENRLDDLWSIFDFLNPGLLGSAKQFGAFTRKLADRPEGGYGPLRDLVRPYVLRRLKTDRAVIADLPDKTEVTAYCPLSRKQAALYEQGVEALAAQLRGADGIQRRGVVLAALTRFKQICNHPSQWLGDGAWAEADSGKLARLREIAETVAARQEKVLVFTQFREITEALTGFLGGVFGQPGLVLHGGTPVVQRQALVRRFQDDERVPFFVLSLKAGGTGLNLTAASHVIHFDRWWNPAVEQQATDRAFRIGQTRNVLVHRFVCRGTVEDRIDQLLASKQRLADSLLDGAAETLLTELPDDELLRLVRLDLRAAIEEA